MTKKTKLIIAIAACALVLLVLICVAVGCDKEESPNTTDPTGTGNISETGDATDPTGNGNTGDTTQPSSGNADSTDPSGGSAGEDDPIIPSVSLGITDRDDFENDSSSETTRPTTGGDNDPTTTPTTAPTSPTTEPTEPTEMPTYPEVEGIKLLTWEEYEALGGQGQRAYKESFPNREDYYAWLEAAQAEYKANHESEFGGNVDIGDILNGNNP